MREYPSVRKKEYVDWDHWEEQKLQPEMEAKSFSRILERQVRKALKTEREEGEYQQKTERSVRYSRVSASHYQTELACFKLLG